MYIFLGASGKSVRGGSINVDSKVVVQRTVQLMAVEMFSSRIALAAAFVWARKVLLQTSAAPLSFPWSFFGVSRHMILTVTALVFSFRSRAPITILSPAPHIILFVQGLVRQRRWGAAV